MHSLSPLEFGNRVFVGILPVDERGHFGEQLGSGVMVDLGGRHFILTAGHNFDGDYHRVAVAFPRDSLIRFVQPGASLVAAKSVADPDVGVLELDMKDYRLWSHMRPVHPSTFANCDELPDGAPALVVGVPADLRSKETVAMQGLQSVGGLVQETWIDRSARSPFEPSERLGFYVGYGDAKNAQTGRRLSVPPQGLSGGPIFLMTDTGYDLIGVVRSVHERWLWCEPLRAALTLLLDHDDPSVTTAVRQAIESLDPGSNSRR